MLGLLERIGADRHADVPSRVERISALIVGEPPLAHTPFREQPERIDSWNFLKNWSPLPVRLGAEGVRLEYAT